MSSPLRTSRAQTVTRAMTAAGIFASCVPMVAMLPGAAAGAFALVGLGASSAAVATLSPSLNPVAEPLLVVSVFLLVVTGLRCSRAAAITAATGGVLLYAAMYLLTDADGSVSPALFYAGLALTITAYVMAWRRRRTARCRPLVNARVGGRLLAGTLVAGALAVGVAAASDDSSSHDRHGNMPVSSHDQTRPGGQSMPGMTDAP